MALQELATVEMVRNIIDGTTPVAGATGANRYVHIIRITGTAGTLGDGQYAFIGTIIDENDTFYNNFSDISGHIIPGSGKVMGQSTGTSFDVISAIGAGTSIGSSVLYCPSFDEMSTNMRVSSMSVYELDRYEI